MLKRLLKKFTNKKEEKVEELKDLEYYKSKLKIAREELIAVETCEDEYSRKIYLDLKEHFLIPDEMLIQMSNDSIVFYILAFDAFKTSNGNADIRKQILEKITDESATFKYSLETGINLLTFYGKEISSKGIENLIYSIIEKSHGDLGVYTTLTSMLLELNEKDCLDIVYSAVSFKFNEKAAKYMLEKCMEKFSNKKA